MNMKQILLTILSLLSVTFCDAQNFVSGNLTYSITGSNAIVMGLSNTGRDVTSLVIPLTITYNSKEYPVTKIGYGAFYNKQNLVTVTIGNNVKEIAEEAFWNCRKMTRVYLSKNLEVIGTNAFKECVRLDSVVLPKTIKYLYPSCFQVCSRLKDIYCLSTTPPEIINAPIFSTYGTLHVLKGYKKTYLDDGVWDYFYTVVDDIDPSTLNEETNPSEGNNESSDNNNSEGNNTPNEGGNSGNETPTTSIQEIHIKNSQNIYSITGNLQKTPTKGISIVGGKKIIMK